MNASIALPLLSDCLYTTLNAVFEFYLVIFGFQRYMPELFIIES